MSEGFSQRLSKCSDLPDVFEVVKDAVSVSMHRSRGGLMLGLADLGNDPNGFLGAFYPVSSNIIVMNRIPMIRIKQTRPALFKPYAFHVLMHEYLHSLGFLDEAQVRQMVYSISFQLLGQNHLATKIAENPKSFFPNLVFPDIDWKPEEMNIELVQNFDRGSASYIQ